MARIDVFRIVTDVGVRIVSERGIETINTENIPLPMQI